MQWLNAYFSWYRHPLFIGMAFVLIICLLLISSNISSYEMNLSSLIQISQTDPGYQPDKIDKGYVVYKEGGYDGQYNYYLIKDFPLKGNFRNPFRAQRILYPFLGWLFSLGGKGSLIPSALVLINLASILGGMAFLYNLMETLSIDRKIFLCVLYGLNPGFITALLFDLGTPLAMMLILWGYYEYKRKRWFWVSLALGLSLLTMENAWLMILPAGLWLGLMKQWKPLRYLGLSLIPWLMWQFILTLKWGVLPVTASAGFLDIPFKGIWLYLNSLGLIFSEASVSYSDLLRQLSVFPLMGFLILLFLVTGFLLFKDRSLLFWILLFHCLFAIFLSYDHIWSHTITSSGRVLCGIFPFLYLSHDRRDDHDGLSVMVFLSGLLVLIGLARIIFISSHPYFVMP